MIPRLRNLICLADIPLALNKNAYSQKAHFSKIEFVNSNPFRQINRHFKTERKKVTSPGNANFEGIYVETGPTSMKTLSKPFIFTIMFSAGSIGGCALWQYENMRSKALSILMKSSVWFQQTQRKTGVWRNELNQYWNTLTEDQKLFIPIFLINSLVFIGWRIPRFQPIMAKYFCSNPAAKVICWPMILSTFSHYSLFHLLANMFVLHSFSSGAIMNMGKEQFLGMYLAGGVISSFTSYVHKVMLRQPSLSLGASGAIMAVLGYVCSEYPETRLSIIFLPMFTFSAGVGLKALIAVDMAGVLFGWKFFDHAAHLGGALWGITWCYFGREHIWQKREPLLQFWHKLRGSVPTK